jgi:hypothetical protein
MARQVCRIVAVPLVLFDGTRGAGIVGQVSTSRTNNTAHDLYLLSRRAA